MKLPSKKRILIEVSLILGWFIFRFFIEQYFNIDVPIYISLLVIFVILIFAQKILEALDIK
tara:strand:+ start:3069 stop:3251 length:183 start_codon:yes stop_codon:yes gene_type:complete